jgi:hypothetical protein
MQPDRPTPRKMLATTAIVAIGLMAGTGSALASGGPGGGSGGSGSGGSGSGPSTPKPPCVPKPPATKCEDDDHHSHPQPIIITVPVQPVVQQPVQTVVPQTTPSVPSMPSIVYVSMPGQGATPNTAPSLPQSQPQDASSGTTHSTIVEGGRVAAVEFSGLSNSGAALLDVSCASGRGSCAGSIRLTTRVRRHAHLHNVTLATKSFEVASGADKTIRVQLSSAARRLLERTGLLKARLSTDEGQIKSESFAI